MRESQSHLGHSVQVVGGLPRVNYTSSRTILLEGSLGPVESFGSMIKKIFYVRNLHTMSRGTAKRQLSAEQCTIATLLQVLNTEY